MSWGKYIGKFIIENFGWAEVYVTIGKKEMELTEGRKKVIVKGGNMEEKLLVILVARQIVVHPLATVFTVFPQYYCLLVGVCVC